MAWDMINDQSRDPDTAGDRGRIRILYDAALRHVRDQHTGV